MVRNTAISLRLSVTVINIIEIILKEATATTDISSTKIMIFSIKIALNKLLFFSRQSINVGGLANILASAS